MKVRGRREGGSVSLVTAALLLITVVLALACVDVLRVLSAKDRAQTAADAAALAAAQNLVAPSEQSPAEIAAAYAADNGATLVVCRCDAGSTEALVIVERSVSLPFLGGNRTVRASARAVIEQGLNAVLSVGVQGSSTRVTKPLSYCATQTAPAPTVMCAGEIPTGTGVPTIRFVTGSMATTVAGFRPSGS
jgi:secretion/DNA translocation related TadE-like protein